MVRRLASFVAAFVAALAIVAPAHAVGIEEARQKAHQRAQQDVSLGDEAFGSKQWDAAIDHYTQAIDGKGCDADCLATVYFHRGVAYQQKSDCAKALADYAKAAETIKDNGDLYFEQSVCHNALNQPDLAMADLNNALKVNPDSTIYHHDRCIALFNKHDFANALPDCEFTLSAAPDDQTMLYATAMSAEQTGDPAKAAKYYKHILELDHNNAQAADGLKRVGG